MANDSKTLPPGLWVSDDGRIFMTRCPKCHRENYAPAVSAGICAWCGYDANEDYGEKHDE